MYKNITTAVGGHEQNTGAICNHQWLARGECAADCGTMAANDERGERADAAGAAAAAAPPGAADKSRGVLCREMAQRDSRGGDSKDDDAADADSDEATDAAIAWARRGDTRGDREGDAIELEWSGGASNAACDGGDKDDGGGAANSSGTDREKRGETRRGDNDRPGGRANGGCCAAPSIADAADLGWLRDAALPPTLLRL